MLIVTLFYGNILGWTKTKISLNLEDQDQTCTRNYNRWQLLGVSDTSATVHNMLTRLNAHDMLRLGCF